MPLNPAEQLVSDGIYFLVGAGASRYVTKNIEGAPDFPLGSDLLKDFISEMSKPDEPCVQTLPIEQVEWFEINKHGFTSIDSLLERAHGNGFAELIDQGRIFVDDRISKAEAAALDKNGNFVVPWVGRLLDLATRGVSCYEHAIDRIKAPYDNCSQLTFHTLNYDRVIEFSLFNYLIARFANERHKIEQEFHSDIEWVRHLHGSLGTLKKRPFGQAPTGNKWVIRFWFETSPVPLNWPIQNRILDLRKNWVFLGFGFHDQITSRIDASGQKVRFYVTDASGGERKKIQDFQTRVGLRHGLRATGAHCNTELIDQLVADYEKPSWQLDEQSAGIPCGRSIAHVNFANSLSKSTVYQAWSLLRRSVDAKNPNYF